MEMFADTLWWPDFRHLRAAAYTHTRLRESKMTDNFVLFHSSVFCHVDPFQRTTGINEYALHTLISTYGPNKNNV